MARNISHNPPSIVAAAQRLTTAKIDRHTVETASWQSDAWRMLDQVGEFRFLATTIAERMSRARLYVGKRATDPTKAPEPVEDGIPAQVVESLGSSEVERAKLIERMGVNLFVAGDTYLVGIDETVDVSDDLDELDNDALNQLTWYALSVDEISQRSAEEVKIQLPDDEVVGRADEFVIVKIHRPHPRDAREPDSPARAALPILRELVLLTMHVEAQAESRLAGAGVLVIPESMRRQMKAANPTDDDSDPLLDALMDAMETPISDRDSASAVVPLILTANDDAVDNIKHVSFATPFDDNAESLREESIRRLALSLDAPPEILLGQGSMNHWGAWLVREDVVETHLEPPLALICDALTNEILHPVLRSAGFDDYRDYVIWFDTRHMVQRPNRLNDAINLHEAGVISGAALRDAGDFADDDAPTESPADLALKLVGRAPSLLDTIGLPELVRQISEITGGQLPEVDTREPEDRGPSTNGDVPVESEAP